MPVCLRRSPDVIFMHAGMPTDLWVRWSPIVVPATVCVSFGGTSMHAWKI